MPDPDLAPVFIGSDLVEHLKENIGILPDEEIRILVDDYGLTAKDALSLVSLNEGGRVEYFRDSVDEVSRLNQEADMKRIGRLCNSWVLHELGGLVSDLPEDENPLRMTPSGSCIIPSPRMAALIHYLDTKRITGQTAKLLLAMMFERGRAGEEVDLKDFIDKEGLWLEAMTKEQYDELARDICQKHTETVDQIKAGQQGKMHFLLGRLMRLGQSGRLEPKEAMEALKRQIEGSR